MKLIVTLLIAGWLWLPSIPEAQSATPFPIRGYYITFMRMPTLGLNAWKRTVDCVRADGGNHVILWMAGGFRSRKYPETWAYNRDHANVKRDFVRTLIDYAHARGVKVLLGFTPFGYDGVNQMSLTRSEWKATGPDGKPTSFFGIHCWGYNLCPARADTQEFMLQYAREMVFDFYPSADGLLIESSDYAACHCKDCGPKYYENEFRFVRAISGEIWAKKPDATIIVYPHYFNGAQVPGLGVRAAKQPFDPQWTVFFTPHSAHPDSGLIAKARGAIWSDDAPALRTPSAIREGVRRARAAGCNGYLPSLEAFTFVNTQPEEGQRYLVGKRQAPFGFGWLREGEMPYGSLPVRVNRIAFREYTRNPDLSDAGFRAALGEELFGNATNPEAVDDVLTLQDILATERTWRQAAPITSPDRVRAMQAAGQLTEEKKAVYRSYLDRVRRIEERYRNKGRQFAEMHRITEWMVRQWSGENPTLLHP
jgi:hypothetical protein